jgi:hypothetical protein
MSNNAIRSALSAPPGVGVQTTKLADNLQSMTNAVAMLSQTVDTVRGAPPQVQQQLAPLLSQFIFPLLNMGQSAREDLAVVASRMRAFIALLGQTAQQAQGQPQNMLTILLRGSFNSLEFGATAIRSAALNASQLLTNFQNAADNAAAGLNTYKQQLEQTDANLQQEAASLMQQMHDMTSGNCCEQIGHAFQMAFGHLRQELEDKEQQLHEDEYVLMLNNNTIDALSQMLNRLQGIASVATALEVTWRGLADGIGTLQQDLDSILADTSPAALQDDLEYVTADWQGVAATLAKIA